MLHFNKKYLFAVKGLLLCDGYKAGIYDLELFVDFLHTCVR